METKTLLLAFNERFHAALTSVISDLADEQLYITADTIDHRPIAEVAIHAYSNLLGMLAVVAGKEWPLEDWPISDWPANLPHPTSPAALVTLLDKLHEQSNVFLNALSAGALDEMVTLPWGQQQAGEAASDALVHGFHHVGAIAGIRAMSGFPTPPDA